MSVFTNPGSASKESADAYITAVLDQVGGEDPIAVLVRTPQAFRQTIDGLTPAELRMPEKPGKWSMVQVLAHMADAELVWGWRLRMVLAHDRPLLTGYDQDLWAERLGYADAGPEESLQAFATLREGNLRLLRRATADDLGRIGLHDERGEESVQHMMRLFAGHDLVHVRQLRRVRQAVAGS